MSRATFTPPATWKTLYNRIVSYRRETLLAPVDTIGCHCLFDKGTEKETQRFHILVALMLSAQTKDEVTAAAMKVLMEHGLTPSIVRAMPASKLNNYIGKVGFHNNKTKYIKQAADIILDKHHGMVPHAYEELIALPGVGPKMAHLFLQAADGIVMGIGVDTHVHRISQRFNWVPTSVKSPEDTRKSLETWLPKEHWSEINHLLVGLGQTVCAPINPRCGECELSDICPNAFKELKRHKRARSGSKDVVDVEDLGTPAAAPKRRRPR